MVVVSLKFLLTVGVVDESTARRITGGGAFRLTVAQNPKMALLGIRLFWATSKEFGRRARRHKPRRGSNKVRAFGHNRVRYRIEASGLASRGKRVAAQAKLKETTAWLVADWTRYSGMQVSNRSC